MDKSLLMFRGGVRSEKKKLVDGKEHDLHFLARTPNEIALFLGAQNRITDDAAGDVERQDLRARFIANSLCHPDGSPLMTFEEAQLIPATLKPEIIQMVILGSSSIGDAGKD